MPAFALFGGLAFALLGLAPFGARGSAAPSGARLPPERGSFVCRGARTVRPRARDGPRGGAWCRSARAARPPFAPVGPPRRACSTGSRPGSRGGEACSGSRTSSPHRARPPLALPALQLFPGDVRRRCDVRRSGACHRRRRALASKPAGRRRTPGLRLRALLARASADDALARRCSPRRSRQHHRPRAAACMRGAAASDGNARVAAGSLNSPGRPSVWPCVRSVCW